MPRPFGVPCLMGAASPCCRISCSRMTSAQAHLLTLMPAFPPLRFPLHVIYPSRRNLPPRTRIVIEFLTDLIRSDPAMTNVGDLLGQPEIETLDRADPF